MTEEDEEFERIERESAIRRNAIPNQGVNMIVNKEAAMENLVRVCEESLGLIRQLIESQEMAYTAGYEDGMEAQKAVQAAIIRNPQDDI
jgi:hypothetical protein